MTDTKTLVTEMVVTELGQLAKDWLTLYAAKPKPKGSGIYRMSDFERAGSLEVSAGEKLIKRRIHEMGMALYAVGREDLMREVYYIVRETFSHKEAGRIERGWEGIGSWVP